MAAKTTETFSARRKQFATRLKTVEKKPTTKLILLIIANTKDPDIGKGCRQDIRSIRQMFKKLSVHMQFPFVEFVVMGKDYSRQNVQLAMDAVKPDDNDVVVVYYTGHGFSFKKDKEKRYPQVDLRPPFSPNKISVINENTQNLADLFEAVKAKGARLNIVIGDCCNNRIQFTRNFKGGDENVRARKRPRMVINKEMCETLFCDYTASILVAAADKGQFAVSDDKLGSIFTFTFTNNLKTLMNKSVDRSNALPWTKLLEETKKETLVLSKTYEVEDGKQGNQKAIFDIQSKKFLY
ncbi:MAG: caspase family protein [Chitinophagaceae bacterium]|nr:caspase family protein [Chitinophagaceae bacterium]